MHTTKNVGTETATRGGTPVSDLFVDSWGVGTPVVLVHGSLATARFVQDIAERKRHQLETGAHTLEVLSRQRRQEVVLVRIRTRRHAGTRGFAA